jgi:hypothetical protein
MDVTLFLIVVGAIVLALVVDGAALVAWLTKVADTASADGALP